MKHGGFLKWYGCGFLYTGPRNYRNRQERESLKCFEILARYLRDSERDIKFFILLFGKIIIQNTHISLIKDIFKKKFTMVISIK